MSMSDEAPLLGGSDDGPVVVSASNAGEDGAGGMTVETIVAGPFRLWHVVAIVLATLTTLIITICCCTRMRIPRTNKEIEENYRRKKGKGRERRRRRRRKGTDPLTGNDGDNISMGEGHSLHVATVLNT